MEGVAPPYVGALILDDDERVFVQRRSPECRLFPECWDIVRGNVADGESADDALRREVAAATGWRISVVLGPVGEFRYQGDDGQQRVEQDFLVRVDGDLSRPRRAAGRDTAQREDRSLRGPQSQASHTEWRWVTEAELAELVADERPGNAVLREIVTAGFATARRFGVAT